MSIAETWGTTAQERELPYPCDVLLPEPRSAYYRGATVDAPPAVLFRWLCQLRVAPYSYDWIDNFGRQSPQQLTPGLDDLAAGERVMMGGFEIIDFERDRHITARTRNGSRLADLFGHIAATYLIAPASADACRLLVKLLVRYPRTPIGSLNRVFLPWGDLVMMRKQLLNLKRLAERT
jgi:hypothetical protein